MKLKVLGAITQVSPEDCEWALGRRWHLGDTGYVKTYSGRPGGTPLRMHRLVLERMLRRPLLPREFCDHINGDRLDNRRENLRLATSSQNGMNTAKRTYRGKATSTSFIGVCRHIGDKRLKRHTAYVNAEGKRVYLGHYDTAEEAAWMRDQFALALHGDYARLNFEYQPA